MRDERATLYETVRRNKENEASQKYKFHDIFGMNLSDYSCPIFGFDIIKFDESLRTPDGKSTREWVKEKYGQEGLDIILTLMNLDDKEE